MKYEATIVSKFTENPPEGATIGEVYTFTDTYTISPDIYDDESARAYITRDLKLVAGGGYEPIQDKNIIKLTITRK